MASDTVDEPVDSAGEAWRGVGVPAVDIDRCERRVGRRWEWKEGMKVVEVAWWKGRSVCGRCVAREEGRA